jgi:hypothetical protein
MVSSFQGNHLRRLIPSLRDRCGRERNSEHARIIDPNASFRYEAASSKFKAIVGTSLCGKRAGMGLLCQRIRILLTFNRVCNSLETGWAPWGGGEVRSTAEAG